MNRILGLVAASLLMLAAGTALAQPYPNRPVKIVVPYPAGQGTDVAARYLAQQLAKQIGQNVVVENRAGAAGNIGAQFVAKSPADGYTLLMGTNATHAAAPFLFVNPGFDPDADFDPVILTGILPMAVLVQSIWLRQLKRLVKKKMTSTCCTRLKHLSKKK